MRRLIPAHAGKTLRGRGRRRWRRAHPRSRGENAACEGGVSAGSGSSPLTRGKRFCELRVSFDAGLIPAHAGKTTAGAGKLTTEKAHPSSRGENGHTKGTLKCTSGSSPLTRGKPRVGGRRRARVRLIPAHAGKTLVVNVGDVGQQAHPRSRGENPRGRAPRTLTRGSSPLTRGKPGTSPTYQRPPRLIPAHAGKTVTPSRAPRQGRAHPRSRGENCHQAKRLDREAGSSPLTRGKRAGRRRSRGRGRLIPAHAGKTHRRARGSARGEAHPRSRGENGIFVFSVIFLVGSSPLTRGKRLSSQRTSTAARLIPAHAGKTKAAQQMVVNFQAHPRSRGENDSHAPSSHEDSGSSPLTRGKLSQRLHLGKIGGLIPAHAGKTKIAQFSQFSPPAHPRSRGENRVPAPRVYAALGSSPLTRGKPTRLPKSSTYRRLIPAHAGKTTE